MSSPDAHAADSVDVSDRSRLLSERYDVQASAYRLHWEDAIRTHSTRLLDQMQLAGAARVLDLACGTGSLADELHARAPAAAIIGADRSLGMIQLAPHPLRVVADGHQLPLPSGAFDVAVLAFALFHLLDRSSGLREIRRCLKPGGHLGLTTWGTPDGRFPPRAVWEEELERQGAPGPDDLPVLSDYTGIDTPDGLQQVLTDAGFSDLTVWTGSLALVNSGEDYLARVTSMGADSRRFAALPADRQNEALRRARARLAEPDDAFTDESEVLYAIASSRAPDSSASRNRLRSNPPP
ncbi:MAG TPA: class I SAM-dependent methyltransferase [Egibacteraceae bacterium]|nr:class I SAM-dependent methyltransferase [Egibacteraceae bacterium]